MRIRGTLVRCQHEMARDVFVTQAIIRYELPNDGQPGIHYDQILCMWRDTEAFMRFLPGQLYEFDGDKKLIGGQPTFLQPDFREAEAAFVPNDPRLTPVAYGDEYDAAYDDVYDEAYSSEPEAEQYYKQQPVKTRRGPKTWPMFSTRKKLAVVSIAAALCLVTTGVFAMVGGSDSAKNVALKAALPQTDINASAAVSSLKPASPAANVATLPAAKVTSDADKAALDKATKAAAAAALDIKNGCVTQSIPFTSSEVPDANKPVGFSAITTVGVDGRQKACYPNGPAKPAVAALIKPAVAQIKTVGTFVALSPQDTLLVPKNDLSPTGSTDQSFNQSSDSSPKPVVTLPSNDSKGALTDSSTPANKPL